MNTLFSWKIDRGNMTDKIKYKIGASLACANQLELGSDIDLLIKNGIDFLHIDIMDGIFVNNYCFGTKIFDFLKRYKDIEIETHLMVEDPINKIDIFKNKHMDRLSFHIEASGNPIEIIKKIKGMKYECGVALDIMTSEEKIKHLYNKIDYVLVMAVKAGFTGQEFNDSVLKKIKRIRNELEQREMEKDIYVDGHIDSITISELSKVGANAFVGGSSGLFIKGTSLPDNIKKLSDSYIL
jgi:ribulose-phosphate 3-epimerase